MEDIDNIKKTIDDMGEIHPTHKKAIIHIITLLFDEMKLMDSEVERTKLIIKEKDHQIKYFNEELENAKKDMEDVLNIIGRTTYGQDNVFKNVLVECDRLIKDRDNWREQCGRESTIFTFLDDKEGTLVVWYNHESKRREKVRIPDWFDINNIYSADLDDYGNIVICDKKLIYDKDIGGKGRRTLKITPQLFEFLKEELPKRKEKTLKDVREEGSEYKLNIKDILRHEKYLGLQIEKLESLWKIFRDNDSKILEFRELLSKSKRIGSHDTLTKYLKLLIESKCVEKKGRGKYKQCYYPEGYKWNRNGV